MTEYRVYLKTWTDVAMTVEADDPDEAIDKAMEDMPRSICAQCSGWGQKWSRDEGEYEPYEVADAASGETVWRDKVESGEVSDG